MRILATNPDTIGDVVLRQPLYRALSEAGHELMLVVRPLLGPLISAVAPGARVFSCGANLYDPKLEPQTTDLDDVVEAAKAFNPDLLLIAPYQWTVLEERLALELPSARCVAMSGKRYSDPEYGPAPESTLEPALRVDVAEDAPEVRKNELLAGAALGRAMKLPDPEITPAPEDLRAADVHLARLGLEAGKYWVACVGDSRYTRVRNWRPAQWAKAIGEWAARGKRFLFIGHQSELATTQEVIEEIGDQTGAMGIWTGDGEGDLDVLLGLISQSAGYVGRDTGPMHLAAAMRKPVLALFGGGTWPRFLPAAERSVSLAVGVPCVGCGWNCELPESYCVKDVPVGEVLRAMEDLESGRVKSRDVRLLDPGKELLAKIGREGAARARERRVTLSVVRRELMEQNDALTAVLERSVKRAGEADRLAEELDALKGEMTRRESILRKRLAGAENLWRAREGDLQKKVSELESAEAAASHRLAAAEAQGRARDEEISHLRNELLQARGEAADAQLRVARADTDQAALGVLTRQQEDEIRLLRIRLRQMVASRWRKYGQRLHLCMTMPWEREMSNGHH
jgi:ADP-heptose:LPS heptosyltransferase